MYFFNQRFLVNDDYREKYREFVNVDGRFRSSRPNVFCWKDALRNFAKFTGKHLCQSLRFNNVEIKIEDSGTLKYRLWHRCFLVNFAKFLRIPFFYRRPQVAASDFLRKWSLNLKPFLYIRMKRRQGFD